jgi:hypothetical protein
MQNLKIHLNLSNHMFHIEHYANALTELETV